jgi:MFS family permease
LTVDTHKTTRPPRLALLPIERRALGSLSSIYAARMLGLFLLLPVLALYTNGLAGATPLKIGLAMGAYGLTQAILQIPFGLLSDRYGRRGVITVGLVLYAAGSVIGGMATGIEGIILARMVQGAGAISGPVSALLADLTRPEIRTRAMALIGISIGGSFVVSLVAAPPLESLIGVRGIFWAMAVLAVLCLVLLHTAVPAVERTPGSTPIAAPRFSAAFTRTLVPYYVGVFVLNVMLTAAFVGVPHALADGLGIPLAQHWKTYLWVFLGSVPLTIPLVLASERFGSPVGVMRLGVAIIGLALGALTVTHHGYWSLALTLLVFFAAFNYLEARVPARLSQSAPTELRGAALGIFATAQFLGAFAGGQFAPLLYASPWGLPAVFGGAALLALPWLLAIRPGRA